VGPHTRIAGLENLIKKCVGGDADAFDELSRSCSSLVTACIYGAFRRYGCNAAREDVEDIHNAFFLSLMEDDFRRLRQFRGESSFETYVRIIIIRQVVDFLRRQKPQVSIDSDSINPRELRDRGKSTDTLIELSDEEQLVREAINTLAPAEQLLLKLAVYRDLEAKKVCKIMNISMVAYYNRKSRVLKKIKKYCEKAESASSIQVRDQGGN